MALTGGQGVHSVLTSVRTGQSMADAALIVRPDGCALQRQCTSPLGRHAVKPAAPSPTTRFLQVKVKPNARASALQDMGDGQWAAQIKAPPVDGRANEELIALVARHFGCRKSAVSIQSGASGRLKRVRIDSD